MKGESDVTDSPVGSVGSNGQINVGVLGVVVELGGRIGDEGLHERSLPAEVGNSLSVDVRGLEDDVIEDDNEQVFGDFGGLVGEEDVEGDGDEEVELHVDEDAGD